MRKIVLFILVIVAAVGCNKQKEDKIFDEYVSKAKTSEIKETKCFLGFQFGWSSEEYFDYVDSLLLQKKIYRDGGDCFYDYCTDVDKFQLKISPSFFNDTLYKMIYVVEDGYSYLLMASGFIEQEKSFMSFSIPSVLDEKVEDLFFIKDNMIVEFSELVGADVSIMQYENAPVQHKIDSIKKTKAKESVKEF